MSENFWMMTTKFSQGKRLNLDLADGWQCMNKLSFCCCGSGNVQKTSIKISNRLCLPCSSNEVAFLTKGEEKSKKFKAFQQTEEFKRRRQFAKLTKDHRIGKLDAKKMHWPEKVKVTESSKSTVKDKMKSPRKLPKCSSCGINGHNMSGCQWPPPMKRKRKNNLVEFDIDEMTKMDEI